jgi:hypothetical protein
MRYIYLVCTGDVESHGVEGAYLREGKAIWEASTLAVDGRYNYKAGVQADLNGREIALFERDDPKFGGRMFGYISIEKHEIVE